jgi:hypothetical protein
MFLLAQMVASLLVLVAFIVPQVGWKSAKSIPCLVLNLVGSSVLSVEAVMREQWGFFVLEAVWAVVSAIGLGLRLPLHAGSLSRTPQSETSPDPGNLAS